MPRVFPTTGTLFTYQDDLSISHGNSSIKIRCLVPAPPKGQCGRCSIASARSGDLCKPDYVSAEGTVTNFQVVPQHTELGWRSLFGAWHVDDSIRLRRNLTLEVGLRQEFTTGWNESQGRASNYGSQLPKRAGYGSLSAGNSVYTWRIMRSDYLALAWAWLGTFLEPEKLPSGQVMECITR